MKRQLLIFATAAGLLATGSCKQATDSVVEALMEQEAKKFNKNGPIMVDEETRIDSIHVADGRKLEYCYTLVNFAKEDLDVKIFRSNLEPTLKKTVIDMKELDKLKEADVIFSYNYADKAGKPVTQIVIGPNDYKKK